MPARKKTEPADTAEIWPELASYPPGRTNLTYYDYISSQIFGLHRMCEERGLLGEPASYTPEEQRLYDEAWYHLHLSHKAELANNTERAELHINHFIEYLRRTAELDKKRDVAEEKATEGEADVPGNTPPDPQAEEGGIASSALPRD